MALSNSDMGNSPEGRSVQDRLVEAGEELFCQRGFNETSVRDIAAAADCNVASINYYFGGKDKLYVEIWRRRLTSMRDTRLASIERVMSRVEPPLLEELLRSYAGAFLEPLVDGGSACRFVNLMAREMIDPHLPPALFMDEMVTPVMRALGEALQAICPWMDETRARYAIVSVVGQLMHAVGVKGMFERCGHSDIPKLDLEDMVDHIVRFSAAGIRAYADGVGESV